MVSLWNQFVTHRAWPEKGLLPSMPTMAATPKSLANSDPRIRFGKHLAALRKAQGWSQEDLALESGLARSYLGGVERGQRNISLLNICKLAETLQMSPSVLMDFDG